MKSYHVAFIIFIFSWCFCSKTKGQDALTDTIESFKIEKNKLFWKGNAPIFLHISTDSTGSNPVRLKSKKTHEYADPMYLDTEGRNFIRTDRNNLSGSSTASEIKFEIYKDSRAPTTTYSFSGKNQYQGKKGLIIGKDVSLRPEAKDGPGVGVYKTIVSVNNSAWTDYEEPIASFYEQSYSVSFSSIDKVGNREDVLTTDFTYDETPPYSKLIVTGSSDRNILSADARLEIESSDQVAGLKNVFYSIDSAVERVYNRPILMEGLAEGSHEVRFYGVDQVNNKEPFNTYIFQLDKRPPNIEASILGEQYQNRGRVFVSTRSKVKLQAEDDIAGVKTITYHIDNGPERRYTAPFKLPKGVGNRIIHYRVVDRVGNVSSGKFEEQFFGRNALNIDMVEPRIAHKFIGDTYKTRDTVFISNRTKIQLLAADDNSGVDKIGYKINNKEGVKYDTTFMIPESGSYSIDYYATDKMQNRNTDNFFFFVDKDGPVIDAVFSMEPKGQIELISDQSITPVYAKGVKLYLLATDQKLNVKSISYKLKDDAEFQTYTKPLVFKKSGFTAFEIKATDDLNNVSKIIRQTIFIK